MNNDVDTNAMVSSNSSQFPDVILRLLNHSTKRLTVRPKWFRNDQAAKQVAIVLL